MKLLTKEVEKSLPKLYSQENTPTNEQVAQVKFFTPWSNWTWYATEFDPEEKIFFGLVEGLDTEFGYFSLAELESVKGPFGLGIERDVFFTPKKIAEIICDTP